MLTNIAATLAEPIIPRLVWKVIYERGAVSLPAKGVSMYPFILEGDVCRFVALNGDEVQLGDVVLFVHPAAGLVAHRFVSKFVKNGEKWYEFKGDTNFFNDPPVPRTALLGRLDLIQRNGAVLVANTWYWRAWGRVVLRSRAWAWIFRKFMKLKRSVYRLLKMEDGA